MLELLPQRGQERKHDRHRDDPRQRCGPEAGYERDAEQHRVDREAAHDRAALQPIAAPALVPHPACVLMVAKDAQGVQPEQGLEREPGGRRVPVRHFGVVHVAEVQVVLPVQRAVVGDVVSDHPANSQVGESVVHGLVGVQVEMRRFVHEKDDRREPETDPEGREGHDRKRPRTPCRGGGAHGPVAGQEQHPARRQIDPRPRIVRRQRAPEVAEQGAVVGTDVVKRGAAGEGGSFPQPTSRRTGGCVGGAGSFRARRRLHAVPHRVERIPSPALQRQHFSRSAPARAQDALLLRAGRPCGPPRCSW